MESAININVRNMKEEEENGELLSLPPRSHRAVYHVRSSWSGPGGNLCMRLLLGPRRSEESQVSVRSPIHSVKGGGNGKSGGRDKVPGLRENQLEEGRKDTVRGSWLARLVQGSPG